MRFDHNLLLPHDGKMSTFRSTTNENPLETSMFLEAAKEYKGSLEEAAKALEERVKASSVLKSSDLACSSIAKFSSNELDIGPLLGKGGFCNVYEIGGFDLDDNLNSTSIEDNSDFIDDNSEADDEMNKVKWSRYDMKRCSFRGNVARYAIKHLKSDLLSISDPYEREQMFVHASMDLAIEAKYLSVVSHPNIVKMRGFSSCNPFSGNYFIILDRLFGTLAERIEDWKITQPSSSESLMGRLKRRAVDYDGETWIEQMNAAYGLSSALKHMHSHRILYRDLKPDNIGFDVRGDIKVFDFGLSTEMFSHLKDENDLYHLTGYVGTLRYMAPEVFFGLPYSTSADVFSFGTVFWQMCALELPFANLSMKMYEKKVMEKELIPRKIRWWPGNKEIYNIMKSCWKRDPLARPLMSEICKTISLKIAQRSGENATDVQFRLESRRSRGSVLSFHPNTSRGSDMSSSSYSSFLSMRISKRNFDNTK